MESQPSRDFSELQKPLESFRAKTKRLKVHPAELSVLWAVAAHLVFLPWALGTMWPWAQWTSLTLAAIGSILVLLPRQYTEAHTGGAEFRLLTWPKLIKFPIFWIGLAFLGYVVLQGLNPAWTYQLANREWWMQRVDPISWLPRGYTAPFRQWNPWRMLVIYTAAWLTVCTIWVGFTRRRSVQLLLIVLGVNGLLLAVFGVIQRLGNFDKIFGFFKSPNASFFSSFVYKNHAGAYLLLALAVTCGLAGWYYLRGLRRMEKSNPSGVIAFFATCIAVGILTSYARGATLTTLVFLLICIGGFVWHQFRLPAESRKHVVIVVLLLVFGYFLKTGFEALRSKEAWDRIKAGISREDMSLEYRERATRAALEMLQENWQAGTGVGSFRFLFPIYQHRHPDLVHGGTIGRRMFWEHAHNDIVQIPIEYGAAGMLLVFLGLGYWAIRLLRSYFWENPLSLAVVLGLLLMTAYSWFDFPFQCPAIFITWCALWPIAALWAQFEEAGSKS